MKCIIVAEGLKITLQGQQTTHGIPASVTPCRGTEVRADQWVAKPKRSEAEIQPSQLVWHSENDIWNDINDVADSARPTKEKVKKRWLGSAALN